jgi:hypothetical protein
MLLVLRHLPLKTWPLRTNSVPKRAKIDQKAPQNHPRMNVNSFIFSDIQSYIHSSGKKATVEL